MEKSSERLKRAMERYAFLNKGILPNDNSFIQFITEVYEAGFKDAFDEIPEIATKAVNETLKKFL